jgi:hypothetical protein
MRNSPFVFQSRNELLGNLRSDITKARAEDFFSKRLQSIADVVRDSIAGNTFRAFRIYRNRHPSTVFREWVLMHLNKTLERLKSITNHESYGNYVHESALDLCTTWCSQMGTEIGYGRSTKLLNLVLKKLACLKSIDDNVRKRIIGFQHVPLDSYTIVGLRLLITSLTIPRNATMKFIETPSEYRIVQKYIVDIAAEASVPPIYYDILAWDMAHPSANNRIHRTAKAAGDA